MFRFKNEKMVYLDSCVLGPTLLDQVGGENTRNMEKEEGGREHEEHGEGRQGGENTRNMEKEDRGERT